MWYQPLPQVSPRYHRGVLWRIIGQHPRKVSGIQIVVREGHLFQRQKPQVVSEILWSSIGKSTNLVTWWDAFLIRSGDFPSFSCLPKWYPKKRNLTQPTTGITQPSPTHHQKFFKNIHRLCPPGIADVHRAIHEADGRGSATFRGTGPSEDRQVGRPPKNGPFWMWKSMWKTSGHFEHQKTWSSVGKKREKKGEKWRKSSNLMVGFSSLRCLSLPDGKNWCKKNELISNWAAVEWLCSPEWSSKSPVKARSFRIVKFPNSTPNISINSKCCPNTSKPMPFCMTCSSSTLTLSAPSQPLPRHPGDRPLPRCLGKKPRDRPPEVRWQICDSKSQVCKIPSCRLKVPKLHRIKNWNFRLELFQLADLNITPTSFDHQLAT